MKLLIINGPNLNLLGTREPEIYGKKSFEDFLIELKLKFNEIDLHYFQTNIEAEIILKLQEEGLNFLGILLNAGAYTHISMGIADAVSSIKTPVIEIHISNIFAREDFRHISYLGRYCIGSISGFGLKGYELGIEYFQKK